MKTIVVTLRKGRFGRLRRLKLLVDGLEVGSIRQGGQETLNVPEDAKKLEGKMDWGKTRPIDIASLSSSDIVVFEPYLTANPFKSLGVTNIPINVSIQRAE